MTVEVTTILGGVPPVKPFPSPGEVGHVRLVHAGARLLGRPLGQPRGVLRPLLGLAPPSFDMGPRLFLHVAASLPHVLPLLFKAARRLLLHVAASLLDDMPKAVLATSSLTTNMAKPKRAPRSTVKRGETP